MCIGGFVSGAYFIQRMIQRKEKAFISGPGALVWMIGGLQIFVSGILGEYVTRIYDDVKERPRYIIDEFDKNEK